MEPADVGRLVSTSGGEVLNGLQNLAQSTTTLKDPPTRFADIQEREADGGRVPSLAWGDGRGVGVGEMMKEVSAQV